MRRIAALSFGILSLIGVLASAGCNRPFRAETTVKMLGPLELPPPVPNVGPVRPVLVQTGTDNMRVAILDVDGLILNYPFNGPGSVGENPVAFFREKLDAIEADRCVHAVVLRINSPGGGVAACITMRRELERFKARTGKPVIACLLDTATGGAYYLASAADTIIAGQGTVTGAIGVVLNLYNLQDLMAMVNILPQGIKAGPLVDIGTPSRPLKEAEKQILQSMADEFQQTLIEDIKKSRPNLQLEEGTTFDGRIFTASQALKRGLIDHVGDLDEAIRMAGRQNNCTPMVVLYRRPNDPARSPHAVTANVPMQGVGFFPSVPGLDRAKLPTFLSIWQPEMSLEKLGGK